MQILWTLLTVLLVLLLIIVLLFALILFFPFKFDIGASKYENMYASVVLSWLFGALKGSCVYENDKLNFKLYIFWIPINTDFLDNKLDKLKKKVKTTVNTVVEELKDDRVSIDLNADKKQKNDDSEPAEQENPKPPKENKTEKNISDKKDFFASIKEKKANLKQKAKEISNTAKTIRYYASKEDLWETVGKVLKSIKLKKSNIYFEFGFDDPSTTGITLGAMGAINAFIPMNIKYNANFERAVFKGNGNLIFTFTIWEIMFPIAVFLL